MMTTAGIPDSRKQDRPTRRYIGIALAIILFGLLLQVRSVCFERVIDDDDLILHADQRGCGPNPIECFHHTVFQLYYRPLFTATFAVGDHLHTRDPIWYHLENLALHVVVCGLGFWFFYLLFARERPALLAGLIFTLHPLQVTAVTWIGGRPDSMALFFLLLFSIGAWNAARTSAISPQSKAPYGWLLLSLLAYTGAVFTKEQCISLLLTLPFLLWGPGRSIPRKLRPWLSLYLLPVSLYIIAAKQIIPFASVSPPGWSALLHVEMIGRTLWYFQHLLALPTVGPIHQSTLGPWDIPQPAAAGAGYLLAALWIALVWRLRRNPALRFCALWTTLTLLPCLNIIPIPSQFASSYRAVIPLLGVAGLLGAALDKMQAWSQSSTRSRQPWMGWAVVVGIFAYYSGVTLADVGNWRNNTTLMLAEIDGDPNFVPAYHGLGFQAEKKGDGQQVDWKQVEQDFGTVISRIVPPLRPGESFVQAVDSPACQRTLWSQSGLRYHPHAYLEMILPHRGWAREKQGHFTAAAEDFRWALLLDPTNDNSRANLRTCYLSNGRVNEALALYPRAAETLPLRYPGSGGSTPKKR